MVPSSDAGETSPARADADRAFFRGLARAFGAALFFSLPLLMTMEMWWLGFYMDRLRIALFMALMLPLLVGLSRFSGFRETRTWAEDAVDALVAYGVGMAASAAVLALFAVIGPSMPLREVVGKVSLQAIPASFGAILARSQLGGGKGGEEERRKAEAPYAGEIFFMVAGAVFLAFNVAPTEEMVLIAYQMTPWHAVALAAVSIAVMHAFVYSVDFRGAAVIPPGTPGWSIFLRYTVVGYAVTLGVSAYVLWTFGRFEDHAYTLYVMQTVVLGFPASLGAAGARLVL
ncbi:MAG TPA: TIGR02587 family membrane protein [Longimicrobium sp.]|nr:TIGR02587 family membrane protein [Longimicrobium sp.]